MDHLRWQIKQDVAAFIEYGFDSWKLDGCGGETDLVTFNKYALEAGKKILLENCHWGSQPPFKPDPTLPPAEGCPWNFYRSSGDVRASFASILSNLATVAPLHTANLSYPGCWACVPFAFNRTLPLCPERTAAKLNPRAARPAAYHSAQRARACACVCVRASESESRYPDMLQVGCAHGPGGKDDPGLSMAETRTHFGAWAIVSSPLTLSHDVNNDTVSDAIRATLQLATLQHATMPVERGTLQRCRLATRSGRSSPIQRCSLSTRRTSATRAACTTKARLSFR